MAAQLNISEYYKQVQNAYSFNFDLKYQQEKVIAHILEKKDCVGVFPTGYGKSICFYLPPLILNLKHHEKSPHISLVISLLKSLMFDQCSNAQKHGIKATCITSQAEMEPDTVKGIKEGKFTLVYISPEMLLHFEKWREHILESPIYQERVCVIAVDEAHILEAWGEDFRPTFARLGELRSYFTDTPFLLLTATCTADILKSTCQKLHIVNPVVETISPDRPNILLNFKSEKAMDYTHEIKWFMDELGQNGKDTRKALIYVRSVGFAGKLFRDIVGEMREEAYYGKEKSRNTILIGMFHAGMGHTDQQKLITEFTKPDSQIRLIICTVAFGMGINIPDIRVVLHWGACESVLEYWQEVGRAGRDGEQSFAYYYATRTSLVHASQDMRAVCQNVSKHNVCIRHALLCELVGYKHQPKSEMQLKMCNMCL